jgi:hypothetical protein
MKMDPMMFSIKLMMPVAVLLILNIKIFKMNLSLLEDLLLELHLKKTKNQKTITFTEELLKNILKPDFMISKNSSEKPMKILTIKKKILKTLNKLSLSWLPLDKFLNLWNKISLN